MNEAKIPINVEADIIVARQAGRDMAQKLGFGIADQTRLATGISELTRNVINYAKRGTCTITDDSDQSMIRVRATVEDHGPGIPDVKRAMADGFSTGRSLGMGLPGTKRLVHDFDISSRPGNTKVTISIARPRPSGTVQHVDRRQWTTRR